jgi:feruloyl esterase
MSEAFGRNTGALGLEDNGLSRGFAVLAGDVGLRRPHPTAAPTAGPEGADRAWVLLATAAKALAAAHYGRSPDRSYFVGCGEGGREGVAFAERWPWVFDGIVAVAPTLRAADAARAAAWTVRQFEAAAPREGGRPVLARALSAEQLFAVAGAVLAQCDRLDGAEDGFVMDPSGCRFDPAVLQCKRGAGADCLTPPQLAALRAAMVGPRDAAGRPAYVAWPWDPGLAAPGWRAWTLGDAPAGSPANARHLDARPGAAEREGGSLRHFRQRDGRLLLMHGAADPVVSAWATVAYLERAQADLGGADAAADVVRAFVVPGMNHCAGGPATDRFDGLEAIVKWVEFSLPPDRIEARGSAVLRDETRPLCPWPGVARYRGAGRIHDSASYACR